MIELSETGKAIIDSWILNCCEHVSNYSHDFTGAYYMNGKIRFGPIQINSSNKPVDIYMIPKWFTEERIQKYIDDDYLYYNIAGVFDPHNPYNDVARCLYNNCQSEEGYLKTWLYWLISHNVQYPALFGDSLFEFQNTSQYLCENSKKNWGGYVNGNAKNLLPEPDSYSYYFFIKDGTKAVLKYFQYQMYYIKANYYMMCLNAEDLLL